MATSSYDASLKRLLVHEGGYTNHPSDPGGPTNFGITIYDYKKYVNQDATAADIKAMTLAQAKSIYRAKYWDAQRCDDLPAGVDYAVFDYGVNSGIGRSGKVLRRVLKLVDNTSVVSDGVILAARRYDAKKLINDICDERLRFLTGLKTWKVFGTGWARRVREVRAAALAMAATIAPEAPMPAGPSSPDRADKTEAPKSIAKSDIGNGAVVAGAGGAATLGMQIWEEIKALPDSLMTALTSAASKPAFWLVLLVVVAAVYIWWRRRNKLIQQGV